MKVLVTGGNGFIGWHVVERLLRAGQQPVIFDRHWPHLGLDQEQEVDFYLGDIRNVSSVMEAVADVDGVIHLAGILGTQETIANPHIALETNIMGSFNVFEACRPRKLPCVYITLGNYWMNNPYSISKRAAEKLAAMYNKEFGTKIAVVRGMNAYGPRQKLGPVRKIIPTFVTRALAGEDIEIYGDGEQRMDMIYVEDLAQMLLAVLEDTHVFGTAIDGGTGAAPTVNEIARSVIAQCESSSRIVYIPMRPGEEPGSTIVARAATWPSCFIPIRRRPLADGLPPTVEWYKNN